MSTNNKLANISLPFSETTTALIRSQPLFFPASDTHLSFILLSKSSYTQNGLRVKHACNICSTYTCRTKSCTYTCSHPPIYHWTRPGWPSCKLCWSVWPETQHAPSSPFSRLPLIGLEPPWSLCYRKTHWQQLPWYLQHNRGKKRMKFMVWAGRRVQLPVTTSASMQCIKVAIQGGCVYQVQCGIGLFCLNSSEAASSHHLSSPLGKMVHSFP